MDELVQNWLWFSVLVIAGVVVEGRDLGYNLVLSTLLTAVITYQQLAADR